MRSNWIEQSINNIQLKIGEASGIAAVVELQMRLLAQKDNNIVNTLNSIIPPNANGKYYWNCRLVDLEKALIQNYFPQNLVIQNRFEQFRKARNKLLHGEYDEFMKAMGLFPRSRELIGPGKYAKLQEGDIHEALVCIDKTEAFEKFRKLAEELKNSLTIILRNKK